MKKTILVFTAVSCINLGMYANSNVSTTNLETEKTELLASTSVNEEVDAQPEASNNFMSKSESRQMKKEQKKQRKGLKDVSTGKKIAAGAFIVVVILLYVLTGGEGLKSR